MENKISFSELPFIYELKKQPNNDEGIPNFLPFRLVIDEKYDLVKQAYNSIVDETLSKVYKISSILGGNSTEDVIGGGYTTAILEFIVKNFISKKNPAKILDIGCGTGYLLHKLKEKGFSVYGIEPGLQARIGIDKYKLPITTDFFPSMKINQKFDLIISSLVLEHIINPESFLIDIKNCLTENGTVILGVPNSEPFISTGDISTLFHEHWSYFTPKSFYNFLRYNGADNIVIEESSFGGLLYAKFNFSNLKPITSKRDSLFEESMSYFDKINLSINKLKAFFILNEKKSIGIYVPGRIINFLTSENILLSNIRFFDDNINTYNHYFPGINVIVENFEGLKNKPTDVVLIMSPFFGDKIKIKIISHSLIKSDRITTWHNIFNG